MSLHGNFIGGFYGPLLCEAIQYSSSSAARSFTTVLSDGSGEGAQATRRLPKDTLTRKMRFFFRKFKTVGASIIDCAPEIAKIQARVGLDASLYCL